MKNQFLFHSLIVLIVSATIVSCTKKQDDPSVVRSPKYKESILEIYLKLNTFCVTNFIPGMSIAVSIDNELVLADGFGYSNTELKVKTSPIHKYRIGQVSEIITALTAAKLHENGQLPLDKPVSELLPNLSDKQLVYTLRQLGGHASGIEEQKFEAGKGSYKNLKEVVNSFINDELVYQPGTAFTHTERGFDLIALLLEESQKESFLKVVRKTLIDTLKLTGTVPEVPYRLNENKSATFESDFTSQIFYAPPMNFLGTEASSGFLSNVFDLVKMGNLLLYPGFLKQETIGLLTTPLQLSGTRTSRYGFGVIIGKDIMDRTFYGAHGGVTGGSAALLVYPEDKIVIAMASNIYSSGLELPVFDVANVFIKQLHPEKKN
jgi:CubicO group peptidase (beta-lactamase class C family)